MNRDSAIPPSGPASHLGGPAARVRGEALLRRPPDLAEIGVSLAVTRESFDEVRRELGERADRLRRLMADNSDGIARDDGGSLWVAPRYDKSGRRVIGAQGTFALTVLFADFTIMQQVVNELFGLPDVTINGATCRLSEDNPAHREARLAAIADGRRRADDYASAFGVRVARLIEVSDLDDHGGYGGGRAMFARAVPDGDAAVELAPEPQEVRAGVSMVFALSEGEFSSR